MKKITLFVLSLGLGFGAFAQQYNVESSENATLDNVVYAENTLNVKGNTAVKASLSAEVKLEEGVAALYIHQEGLEGLLMLAQNRSVMQEYGIDDEAEWEAAWERAFKMYKDGSAQAFATEESDMRLTLRNLPENTDIAIWLFGLESANVGSLDQIHPVYIVFNSSGNNVGLADQINAAMNVRVYPNPATDLVKVSSLSNINTVEVINTLGQVVYSSAVNNTSAEINTSNLEKGNYFIRINNAVSSVTTKVVVK